MYKYFFLFVCAIFCYAQCLPFDATHSASSSTSELYLQVNNSTQSTNYHLSPVMKELEDIDRQIDATLKAILPYFNFFFDSLFDEPKTSDDDDCNNDTVVQSIPEETAMPPTQPDKKEDRKPQPEDKSEPTPDTNNTEGKSEDKTNGTEPVVSPAPEIPVDDVQKNP